MQCWHKCSAFHNVHETLVILWQYLHNLQMVYGHMPLLRLMILAVIGDRILTRCTMQMQVSHQKFSTRVVTNFRTVCTSEQKVICLLQACTYVQVGKNLLPDLPDAFTCCWDDCDRTFSNPQIYFCHVQSHVHCNPRGKNVAGGVPCCWRGQFSVFIWLFGHFSSTSVYCVCVSRNQGNWKVKNFFMTAVKSAKLSGNNFSVYWPCTWAFAASTKIIMYVA